MADLFLGLTAPQLLGLNGAMLGLGAVGNIAGGIQQAKQAKQALDFQRQQYSDWNNARIQDQNNMEAGFSEHFNQNGKRKKGGGLLALDSQGML